MTDRDYYLDYLGKEVSVLIWGVNGKNQTYRGKVTKVGRNQMEINLAGDGETEAVSVNFSRIKSVLRYTSARK